MSKSLGIEFERAARWLAQQLPASADNSRKPILFHSLRVGVYLYENGYNPDVVLAGVLHDAIEWSSVTEPMLRAEFGETVTHLVLANTKNDAITDPLEKTAELIQRCAQAGQDALIVKAADIIDSFKWYASQNNVAELDYCVRTATAIFKYKPVAFADKIFAELKSWQDRFININPQRT